MSTVKELRSKHADLQKKYNEANKKIQAIDAEANEKKNPLWIETTELNTEMNRINTEIMGAKTAKNNRNAWLERMSEKIKASSPDKSLADCIKEAKEAHKEIEDDE